MMFTSSSFTTALGNNSNQTYMLSLESIADWEWVKANGGHIKKQYQNFPIVVAELSDKDIVEAQAAL
jgi:hypothetical protein